MLDKRTDLVAARDREDAGRAVARTDGTEAHNAALEVRDDLSDKLDSTVKGRKPLQQQLASALGPVKDDTALVASLRSLAQMAKEVLARGTDDDVAILAAEFGITGDLITRAQQAATALDEAKGKSAATGPAQSKDSAAINLQEGKVLFEMRIAMVQFENGHRKNPLVPRLIPGSGTRRVLAPRHAAPKPPDAPAAGTSAGAPQQKSPS